MYRYDVCVYGYGLSCCSVAPMYHVGCQLAACLCIVIGSDGVVSGAQVRSVTSVRVTTHRHFVRASVTDSHRVGVGFSEGSNFYKIRPIFKASNFYKIRA